MNANKNIFKENGFSIVSLIASISIVVGLSAGGFAVAHAVEEPGSGKIATLAAHLDSDSESYEAPAKSIEDIHEADRNAGRFCVVASANGERLGEHGRGCTGD
ncbi:hypothetical protein GCM10009847_10730 [Leucobacter tardus]|uniref:Uncharacterized protein n=1 Tax=Leucobacter tardus TaxID=501483 RepID=A0A939QBQ1_9MICO|nr:hypothetical protein [Leucobacter tardus]MBO2989270.1 hypothetical protein [Leucobacter tardus]